MTRVVDIDSRDISLDEKINENISIYDYSYKTFTASIPLCISFDEIDRFIKICDGIRYLVLFFGDFYDQIFDRIKYLISKKVVLQIVIIIILKEPELIHIILYRLKKY